MADSLNANEHYIFCGAKKLRCGFTTGTCAALSSYVAAQFAFCGKCPEEVTLVTPKGWRQTCPVIPDFAKARFGVKKDAGDDPDATDGIIIWAKVRLESCPDVNEKSGGACVIIDGGEGIGRVTKAGLDQKIGDAAINSVPRKMIENAVLEAKNLFADDFAGKIFVTIEAPEGKKIAAKTFNPVLGIEGGISILGTSGVVEPMSAQALIDSIEVEIRVIAESQKNQKERKLIVTPGNFGRDFIKAHPEFDGIPVLACSNFLGQAVDFASAYGFTKVIFVGHAGKFVKVAGGIFNTHSHVADCRMEIIAAHSAMQGADSEMIKKIMECATVDAAFDLLKEEGLEKKVWESIIEAGKKHLARRINGAYDFDFMIFR